MMPEAPQKAHEGAEGEGRQDKGDAETERIDAEQANALPDGIFCRRHRQNHAQHGADARRPAKGEGDTDQIGADQPDGRRCR